MGAFPMAIKVDKRTLKLGNDLELYISEIINKKAGFDKMNLNQV